MHAATHTAELRGRVDANFALANFALASPLSGEVSAMVNRVVNLGLRSHERNVSQAVGGISANVLAESALSFRPENRDGIRCSCLNSLDLPLNPSAEVFILSETAKKMNE